MDSIIVDCERQPMAELNRRFQIVRDRAAGVVKGYHTGFLLTGRGGIGKSHTVIGELVRLRADYRLLNSHVTGRSLFDRFEQYPEAIHLLEEVEDVVRDRPALGVLRSALWAVSEGASRMERSVTWNAYGHSREITFTGGVIMIANRELRDIPELAALKTRISVVNLKVSDAEIAALMHHIVADGYHHGDHRLDAEESLEVAELVISECLRLNRSLDIRLLMTALSDRVQAEDHEAGCSWPDLVRNRIRESTTAVGEIEPVGIRAEKKAQELQVAREIAMLEPKERLLTWKKRTGKSQPTLYRRLAELGRIDAVDFEI